MNDDIKSKKLDEKYVIKEAEGIKTPLSSIEEVKPETQKKTRVRRTPAEKFAYYYNEKEQATLRYFKTMHGWDYNKHSVKLNKFLLEVFYINRQTRKDLSSFQAAKDAIQVADGYYLYRKAEREEIKRESAKELFTDITTTEEIEKNPFWGD